MTAEGSAVDQIVTGWLSMREHYAGALDVNELASKIVAAERERCAKIVENWRDTSDGYSVCECQQQVAAKIRQGEPNAE